MALSPDKCSNSEFEVQGAHGKRPLFSRWPLMARVHVDAQGLILALSHMAVGGE